SEKGRAALSELCQAYWLPLYTFARRSGNTPADAEDLVQGFLMKAVSDRLFARADAERGRLRTFLLTAFRRYARDEFRKTLAEKRGGGEVVSLDLIEAERWYVAAGEPEGESPEQAYDRQWALTLLERTCRRLEEIFAAKGKAREFQALRPFLTGTGGSDDYAAVASGIGMKADSIK